MIIFLYVISLFPFSLAQYIPGLRPDVAFDDHNDRFNIPELMGQDESPNWDQDDDFRRNLPGKTDEIMSFSYHDSSEDDGTKDEYLTNLQAFQADNYRRDSFDKSKAGAISAPLDDEQDNDDFEENLKKLDLLLRNWNPENAVKPEESNAYTSRHQHSHHRDRGTNLLNVQNLNLILKNREKKKKLAAAQALRTLDRSIALETEDRMCQLTGRCGCKGGRCGKNRNSLEQLLDEVEKSLQNSVQSEARDDNSRNQRNNDLDASRDDDSADESNSNQLKGEKYSVSDDLDVIVLDLPSLSNVLENVQRTGKKVRKSQKRILPMTQQQLNRLLSSKAKKGRQGKHGKSRRHLN